MSCVQFLDSVDSGSFGHVSKAKVGSHVCAVKTEPADTKGKPPQLDYEHRVLKALQGCVGIPRVHMYWVDSKGDKHLAMSLLSTTLETELKNKRLPLETLIHKVAPSYIRILAGIHSRGFLHRDLKPANMMLSSSGNYMLIDFGLSKKLLQRDGTSHIPFRTGKKFTGTPRYASINAQLGNEQSWRDDLESLAYVLIYLARGGRLPWSHQRNPKHNSKEHAKCICDIKRATAPEKLCIGLPRVLLLLLRRARSTDFGVYPDYELLASMFEKAQLSTVVVPPPHPAIDAAAAAASRLPPHQ